mmetsp:Transcript_114340/g.330318  ORF Transcript_114340/g.330318 Transcript_114340/m.330318 type:complete len:251 (-) Transcript_114340:469-1221(-)
MHEVLDVFAGRPLVPQLLLVSVSSNEKVQPVLLMQAPVPTAVIAAWEVRHHDLPSRRGLLHFRLEPLLLPCVGPLEPSGTSPDIRHASVACALRTRRVVLERAYVVIGDVRVLGVVGVRVDDEVLDNEAFVLHLAIVVPGGHDPIVVNEGVSDLLRPSLVHLPTAVVVVAQATDPEFVRQLPVHVHPPGFETLLRRTPCSVGSGVAAGRQARIVEVVANVNDVLWVGPLRTALHGVRHLKLGSAVPTMPA